LLRKGEIIQDPFRRGLGYAVQWYDILQVQIERRVEEAVQNSRNRVATLRSQAEDYTSTLSTLRRGRCAPILIQRCPACFAGTMFGKPTAEGGDIHTATDGNFHHRHRRAAGDCPHFYDPTYFLPKEYVDHIGCRIEAQRKRPAKSPVPLVPDEAIDQCETAYEAADGKKQKAAMDSFDDTGIMALICRHDIPLFFANIDSPGEQQKYSVALLEHLFSLIPPHATVVALYDVGCVLARSLSKVSSSGLHLGLFTHHL
jgi:Kyakuja-Dileera-Zisupton transposase